MLFYHQFFKVKKLILALTTFLLIVETFIEDNLLALDLLALIYYSVNFKNHKIWALINSSNKVNIITSGYALQLGLKTCQINVKAQKTDDFSPKTFGMVLIIS